MRYKNTANGYCLRLSTAFEYEVHRKSTTNPRTMQIIREKNAKFLEIYPDFGGEGNLFPLSLYMKWNEIYRDIIYIYFLYVMQKQCICIKNLCICIENRCICIDEKYPKYICFAFALHLECNCIEMVCICIKKRCICIASGLHVHFIWCSGFGDSFSCDVSSHGGW